MAEQKIDDGGAAFPEAFVYGESMGMAGGFLTGTDAGAAPGMSLRDWFAGQRLACVASTRPSSAWQWLRRLFGRSYKGCSTLPEDAARSAYQYADALLAAREEGGGA